MILSPKESGKFIAEKAKHVKINSNGIEQLGKMLLEELNFGNITVNGFSQTQFHPKAEDPWALDWIFLVDALNYCFWSMENEIGWTVENETGYFALCKAVHRAMSEGVDIVNPKFYATITESQLSKILRSDNDIQIPLFQERLKCLHEVGNSLLENFGGSFSNCVKQANNSAVTLLNLIVDNFKSFRDEAIYEGSYQFDRLHHNGFKKLNTYGSIVREEIVPRVNLLWLFKPEDIETLFRVEGKYPHRRSHLALEKYRLDKPNIYNTGGLLPTNGPEWMRLRSALQKGLSSPTAVQNFLPAINDVVQEWLLRLKELSKQPNVDYLPELSRLFLELICVAVFDLRLDSFSKRELKPTSRSTKLMQAALVTNSCILKTDNGPQLWKKIDTPLYRKFKKAQQYMEDVTIDLLSLKMSIFREHQSGESMSLLESYLSSPELDFKDIIGAACDFILAGIDTTAFSTSFLLYHIAKNETAQETLYKECRRLLPSPFSPITKEVLAQAQYAKAVLKESLRLRPVSVGIGRILDQDAIFSGYEVPKGAVVVTQNQVVSVQEQYFDNPRKFIPERWLKNHNQYKAPHPFLVLPFGHGPRSCIGRRLAEQNMLVILMKICSTFKLGWSGENIDTKSLLINKPDAPINLTLKLRRTLQ